MNRLHHTRRPTPQPVHNQDSVAESHAAYVLMMAVVLLAAVLLPAGGCGQSASNETRPEIVAERVIVATEDESETNVVKTQTMASKSNTGVPSRVATGTEVDFKSEGAPRSSQVVVPSEATSAARYRLAKLRTAPADSVLAQHGLRRVESKRLLLITDSDDAELDQFPAIADQLFDALQAWFGELPEAADGSDFQVLGHVMIDRAKFRAAGLLPDESFTILHGRHQRYAFWAGYPDTPYYRRHLALHEFVHCFMTCESEHLGVPSPWYLEGMAELFGTHVIDVGGTDGGGIGGTDGGGIGLTEADYGKGQGRNGVTRKVDGGTVKATFAVMPTAAKDFEGWGRVRAFREDFAAADHQQLAEQQIPPFDQVVPDRIATFETPFQYSASWAACWFLANHPDAQDVMPALAKQRTYSEFVAQWRRQSNEFGNRLNVDWLLFAEQLDFGFDAKRCFPVHVTSDDSAVDPLAASQERQTKTSHLDSGRGWQDSGIVLRSGQTATIDCSGRCVVNHTTEPWESSPDGISIEYYRGHRLGQVVGVLVSADGQQISDRIAVGSRTELTANFAGRIWLQVNDACDGRANNSGGYQVQLRLSP